MSKYFLFGSKVIAIADAKLNNETVRKLWNSFSYGCSEIEFCDGHTNTFVIGEIELPVLSDGKE